MTTNIYNGGIIGARAVGTSGVWGVGDQGLTYGTFFDLSYLVIAGGGGGSGDLAGGGGAGGYRCNVQSENSGGGANAEQTFTVQRGAVYALTVGAGGTGGASAALGTSGNNSQFADILATGGGRSGNCGTPAGANGGSGGGAAGINGSFCTPGSLFNGGSGTTNQGRAGGNRVSTNTNVGGGGGGGASVAGSTTNTVNGGAGGAGVASSITGSSVTRAGGGGGGGTVTGGTGGAGGAGGGGAGGAVFNTGANATQNTGSGGGGGGGGGVSGGNGGSGVIILRTPEAFPATFSAGVTQTSNTSGGFTVYTITQAGPTDTVTFN